MLSHFAKLVLLPLVDTIEYERRVNSGLVPIVNLNTRLLTVVTSAYTRLLWK
jgi:hypothetical protein